MTMICTQWHSHQTVEDKLYDEDTFRIQYIINFYDLQGDIELLIWATSFKLLATYSPISNKRNTVKMTISSICLLKLSEWNTKHHLKWSNNVKASHLLKALLYYPVMCKASCRHQGLSSRHMVGPDPIVLVLNWPVMVHLHIKTQL